ncbi:MAG: YybH family protein [Rhizomicrobium sp.]
MNAVIAAATISLLISPALAAPKDEVLAADKAFSDLSAAKGSNAAFLAYLADDGRLFGTGNQPPIIGKAQAVRRFATSGNGDPRLNVLSWTPDNAEVSDALGYSDGHWQFAGHDAKGAAFKLTGHYMTVWRKEVSGWKVIADMGTADAKK